MKKFNQNYTNYRKLNNKTATYLASLALALMVAVCFWFSNATVAKAASPTDEILNYEVTAYVNDDASVHFTYHIEWLVLDSDSLGPLSWADVGLPNKYCENLTGLSDTVTSVEMDGTHAKIYLDRDYYAGEVADFTFSFDGDRLYQMNTDTGFSKYSFTPGWFDEIAVDNLTIRWADENVDTFWPECRMEDGAYVWTTSLEAGDSYTVEITYPLEAYAFDESHNAGGDDESMSFGEAVGTFFGVIIVLILLAFPILIVIVPVVLVSRLFNKGSGFRQPTQDKITRTIIEYYSNCPNCGAGRPEGKEVCEYCGTNLVKSKEEIVDEKKLSPEDQGALKYKTSGDYQIGDNPHRYVHVNVVHVPTPRPSTSSSHSSHSSGSHHSSCAHSSCACACACACAGGGRAGCSTKDFYNTKLKLRNLKLRNK